MAEKNEAPFLGGFDVLSEALLGTSNDEGMQTVGGSRASSDGANTQLNDDGLIEDKRTNTAGPTIRSVDPEFFKMPEPSEEEEEEDEDEEEVTGEEDDENENEGDDEEEDEGDDDKGKKAKTEGKKLKDDLNAGDDDDDSTDNDSALDDIEILEEEVTSIFKEKFEEELGWDFSKMEKEPKNIKDIVEFMKDAVAEASIPEYANEEVEAYDKFVRNGGDLREFYKEVMLDRVDPSKIDIEEVVDQKRIIRQNFKNQGLKDSIIEKRIQRYDEAGVLLEEAEEALQMVEDYDKELSKKLLETQQKRAEDIQNQQQSFIEDVQKNIKELSDIKGIKISEKDKKELRDYILVTDADGLTQYQKDYLSDINNLLESAYFTKNKEVLLDRAKRQGASDSLKNLQKKLNQNKGNRGKNSGSREENEVLSLGDLGSRLGVK